MERNKWQDSITKARDLAARRRAFIDDIVALCERHGLWLSHEDTHGAFRVVLGPGVDQEEHRKWLRDASLEVHETHPGGFGEPQWVVDDDAVEIHVEDAETWDGRPDGEPPAEVLRSKHSAPWGRDGAHIVSYAIPATVQTDGDPGDDRPPCVAPASPSPAP